MKQICPIHRFSYSGERCPFCEKERLDRLVQKYGVVNHIVDHTELLKPELKPQKGDLEITEDKLKELVNKFNSKSK